ncbi:phosphomannomutase/phosphoglucomutase [Patescibacteria group bacterium]|nr:phosphomannomutase/phosphoglucomutase [Patescibacteria group bacterium]MBU1663027.1 phosphomannomutase/phosphoglucomutase [Patescibacteria group bacterium]MBU1934164.1 phosphomannomutase/phosphoglucomutase [Patescibacteria group bacterium]MBU2007551.1 phosphomannomutase/phosphoglucomutase [Patescibacteria group bacterium]MBU2233497.1 phosphomannomutase/phosphoglucomutase [Patescibacteria group bacterium]
MKINPLIFRCYDIRGIVDKDLNVKNVEAIGKAYGTFLNRRKIRQAVAGRDCRLSGQKFKSAFIRGLISTGVNVIDLGMVMTQMVYYGQYRFQVNGGAMITASHNPFNYNGFKLAVGFSKTTEIEEVQEIRKYVEMENFYQPKNIGKITKANIKEDYFNDVLKRIKLNKKFKVVVDFRHGTPAMYVPELLRRAGCEVISKRDNIDGSFPAGTPDPTDEDFIKELAQVVIKEKADFGLGFDGDGDRIGAVDETGRILWNDVLVAIFAKEILERFPGSKIIYNTLCSRVVPEVVKQNNGIPIIWRTGHSFIKSKIAEENAAFGGELSGHFYFNDNAYGYDDGSYAALRILEYLSDKNTTLSKLYQTFSQYHYVSSPEIKIGCPDEKKIEIIKNLSQKFKADFPNARMTDDTVIPGDDGTRADFSDGMIIFRYSQNGPYITVKFEAKDQMVYDQRKKYVREMLKSYPEMIWEDELCVNLDHLNKT